MRHQSRGRSAETNSVRWGLKNWFCRAMTCDLDLTLAVFALAAGQIIIKGAEVVIKIVPSEGLQSPIVDVFYRLWIKGERHEKTVETKPRGC